MVSPSSFSWVRHNGVHECASEPPYYRRNIGPLLKTQITELKELNLEQDVLTEFEEEFKNKPYSLWLKPNPCKHVDMHE